jgi:hypothetical protein
MTDPDRPGHVNDLTGQANVVFQGRDVHGDITIISHSGEAPLPPGTPPVFVTARLSSTNYRASDYLVDASPDQLPPPDERLILSNDVHQLVDHNCLSLTVEGRTSQAVVLERLRIHVVRRRPASVPRGVRLQPVLWLGFDLPVRSFLADVRSSDVALLTPLPLRPGDRELTRDFPFGVDKSAPEILKFHLDYGDEDIEWLAELDWLSAGKPGTVRIDNAGAPFVSTAFHSRPVYAWRDQEWHRVGDEGWFRRHRWYWNLRDPEEV